MSKSVNLRAQLILILFHVEQGQSLTTLQPQYLAKIADKDKALFYELSLGTLRQWFALKSISLPLLKHPINEAKVLIALYLGLYQLFYTRIGQHAAINETVEAVKQLGFTPLAGVVNAILRHASRHIDELSAQLEQAHALPSWLYKRLKKDWADHTDELCQQLRHPAPLTLRINQRLIGRDAYLAKLLAEGIQAQACRLSDTGIVLQQAVNIENLLGYAQGWFMVQDEHAQLAAQLLPPLNDATVLDACAAPGGKACHILEKFKPSQLIAMDITESRLLRVQENLDRLKLNTSRVQLTTADATTWQSPTPLDCIILDAPCTATGVIRRHPDIRLLRKSEDIAQTVQLQKAILNNLWQQLKVGGTLLYITCSLLKAENEQQMVDFFNQHPDAQETQIQADWGIAQQYGRQLLPTLAQGDGFYYCLIKKQA